MKETRLPARPAGLTPGTPDWLREVEGPRLLQRLVDEVHAKDVGEMTPTGARCAAMLIDRLLPSLATVHHTVETRVSRMSEEELRAKLREIQSREAEAVEFTPSNVVPIDIKAHSEAEE